MRILILSIISFCTCSIFAQDSISEIDSLTEVATSRSDTNAALAYYEWGKKIFATDKESSIRIFQAGLALSKRLDYSRGIMFNGRSLGSVLGRVGQYDASMKVLDDGLKYIEEENLPIINKVDFLINKGATHYFAGFTGKAIETYIEAVEICRANDFDSKRTMLLNNLGIFYRSLDRHAEAIDIYKEAFAMRATLKDSAGMANIAHNLATAHSKINDYENAISQLNLSKEIYEDLNESDEVLINQIALGNIYLDMDRTQDALNAFDIVASNDVSHLALTHQATLYGGLAKLHIKNKNFTLANVALQKIESKIEDADLFAEKTEIAKLKALTMEGLNDFRSANEHHKKYISLMAENSANESQALLKEMETKYLSKEKDHEIALLNSEKELSFIKLKSANERNILMGIGLAIFGLLAFWLFRVYQKLKVQNARVTKANNEKSILLKEIHHRVKNNLQVVSSLLGLQSRYVEDDSALAAIKTGRARVQSMSLLHQNVYKNENLKSVNIEKYFEDLGQNLFTNYRLDNKEIIFETDIDDLELDIDVVVPMGLITNELISNSLKYAFVNKDAGRIKLSIKEMNNQVTLSVSDDGVGIPFTDLPEKSTSLGMQLIKSFAHKLKAEVQIDNTKGTTFRLKFNPRDLVVAAA